jgi:hypothetical protein
MRKRGKVMEQKSFFGTVKKFGRWLGWFSLKSIVFLTLCGGLYGVGYYLWNYETDQTYLTCDWTRCIGLDCKENVAHTTHYKITKGLISGESNFYKENTNSAKTKVSSVIEKFGVLNEDGVNYLTAKKWANDFPSNYRIYTINRVNIMLKVNSFKLLEKQWDGYRKSNKKLWEKFIIREKLEFKSWETDRYWSSADKCESIDRKTFITSVEKRIKERVGKRKF